MRWLNERLQEERGATAVFFALLLIPLIAIAAISVDVGALYANKAYLQNSADAAALKVAIACAHDETSSSCVSPDTASIATANDPVNGAVVNPLVVNTTTNLVTAAASSGASTPFAALLPGGARSSMVSSSGAAEWGPITGGSTLPLAVGLCDYVAPTTPPTKVTININNNGSSKTCDGTSVPGGFGWLAMTSLSVCASTMTSGDWVNITTGNNPPGNPNGACNPTFFQALIGTTVLLPIIGATNSSGGSGGQYQITAFAEFVITGYNFQGGFSQPDNTAPAPSGNTYLQGYFTNYVSVGDGAQITPTATCQPAEPCAMGAQLTLRTS